MQSPCSDKQEGHFVNANLIELELEWETPHDAEAWKELLERGTLDQPASDSSPITMTQSVVLGPAVTGTEQLSYAVVLRTTDSDPLSWRFIQRPKPKSEPPASVLEREKKVGGTVGLATLVRRFANTSPVAEFEINALLSAKEWHCPSLDNRLLSADDSRLAEIGRVARIEQLGFRFEDGVNGIREVVLIYLNESTEYYITIQARSLLSVRDDLTIPYASDTLDLVLSRAFDKRLGA